MPTKVTDSLGPYALTFMRLVLGVAFVLHGLPKIERPGSANNIVAALHWPAFLGWIPTVGEPLCGVLLILGLATPFAGVYLMLEMFTTGVLTKILIRHVPFIVSGTTPGVGWELDTVLFAMSFAIVALGPGLLALDNLLARRAPGTARLRVMPAGS